jgi:hypothetical protein
MLLQLYPRVHRRYSSLPVFGPIADDFGAWLLKQGYSTDCIREHFCCMRRIARLLRKRGVGSVAELTRANCGRAPQRKDSTTGGSLHQCGCWNATSHRKPHYLAQNC